MIWVNATLVIVLVAGIAFLGAAAMRKHNRCDALEAAIRRHRDQRGDDRCWMDDEVLYVALPEGFVPPERDSLVELARCQEYIACRHNPATRYVSPQRRIEELEREYADLRGKLMTAAERIAAQSELLSKRAARATPEDIVDIGGLP